MAAAPPRTAVMASSTLALAVAALVSLASLAAASKGWIVQGTTDNGAPLRKDLLKSTVFEHMLTGSPDPDNLYQKAARMANESAFVFYRGNARLFYPDVKFQDVVSGSKFYSDQARVWIQGDLHMLNMGTFADNTDTTIFDGNDFDEAWPASYLYDVYRLAASIVLVAYDNKLNEPDAKDLVRSFAKAYIKQVKAIYDKPELGSNFELTVDNADGFIKKLLKKKGAETRKGMLDEWTTPGRVFDGEGERAADIITRTELGTSGIPKKLKPDDGKPPTQAWLNSVNAYLKSLRDDIDKILEPGTMDTYRKTLYDTKYSKSKYDAYFAIKDVAVRIEAGLGSFGTNRFYVLIEGETGGPDDDRILDVKVQNNPSIYGSMLPAETNGTLLFGTNNALRTVLGQRATLIANNPSKDYKVDIHLGFMVLANGHFYSVRERSPNKGALTKYIANSASPLGKADLETIVEQYGQVMAADHTRSDNDTPFNVEFGVIVTCFECVVHDLMRGYKPGDFADDIAAFAIPYAEQVKVDQALWKEMVEEGAFTTIDTMAHKKNAVPTHDELR